MMVLFSEEFIPAALLLLLMLPADLFRMTSETAGLALIAKKRLAVLTSCYLVWAALYASLALYLMPQFGILGAAMAYLMSYIFYAVLMLCVTRFVLGYRMAGDCAVAFLRGVMLVAIAAGLLWVLDNRWVEYALCTLALLIWFAASMRDPYFHRLITKAVQKLRPS